MHHCNVRDIINSGHNVLVKKRITSFTVTKVRRVSKYTFLATAIPITSIFNAARFDENPFKCRRKEDKRAEGFQISLFYRSFSNAMAVKGLTDTGGTFWVQNAIWLQPIGCETDIFNKRTEDSYFFLSQRS